MSLESNNNNVSPFPGGHLLNFPGSARFRDKLLARNLKPYSIEGKFSYEGDAANYPVKISDDPPKDTTDISNEVFEEATLEMKINKYGPANEIIDFANIIGNNAGLVSMQQQGLGTVQVPITDQQSQYGYSQTYLQLVNEFFITSNEVVNRYFPEEGYLYSFETNELILQKKSNQVGEYPSFTVPDLGLVGGLSNGIFNLFEIGNLESTLSEDSYLQQISIGYLQEAFRERINREVYRNTIGKVNLQAFSDPFTASLLASGQQSLIESNYTITVPDGVVDQAAYLLQRFSGTYIPVSPIEGDYFESPPRRKTKFGQFVQSTVNFFTKPATPTNRSIKFLNNTGSGQKNVLFNNIGWNIYKPNYDFNTSQVGLAIDTIFGRDNSIGKLYIGDTEDIQYITSPRGEVPYDPITGIETTTPVLGPDAIAKIFEGPDVDQYYKNWGLASKTMGEDGGDPTGGFSWVTSQSSAMAGRLVGPDNTTQVNGAPFGTNPSFDLISGKFVNSQSNRVPFRKRSILENTQRLVESAEKATGKERLLHVGNAINQVSKVFHDGYKELTKGSKVRKYVRKNGTEVGMEYGRVFTKDSPYMTFANLQSTVANDLGDEANGNIRRFTYSVLDSTYNLNIAPTNVTKDGVKKYMFSIENLAWRGTPEFEALPICEQGPNGGRIMWFPPYNLEIGSETSSPQFNANKFLGRPEPIYTYESTERSGSINWSIVVDHPSITNLIIRRELENVDDNTSAQVLASFFAGLKKYDIYDLARRYNTLSQKTIQEAYQQVLESDKSSPDDINSTVLENGLPSNLSSTSNQEIATFQTFLNYGFYFNQFNPNEVGLNYEDIFEQYNFDISQFIANGPPQDPTGPTAEVFLEILDYNRSQMEELRLEIMNVIENKLGVVEITFTAPKILGDPESTTEANYWIESAKKYFNDFVIQQGKTIGDYVGKYLTYKTIELGTRDTNLVKSLTTQEDLSCVGDATGQYNFNDCACRAIIIDNIVFTPADPAKSSGDDVQVTDQTGQRPSSQVDIPTKLQGISKKILRELLTECHYFDTLKRTDSILFEKIKDKFKFFSPAFHSITPEGLNARLVFLHQCVRPGKTIPTKKSETENNFYNDAFNTNFGSPPVLILRFGDFYNTKIIPDNFSITYENIFDFNPEGIGFQPMIAKISLGFKMIGGHGLKEPVEKLQNALTFNYFANTEMYDERAEATEPTDAIDKALITGIYNEEPLGRVNNVNNVVVDNGKTFGDIISANQSSGGTQTGQIQYKNFFNGFVDKVQKYFTDTMGNYVSFIEEYNQGLWYQVNWKTFYSQGFFNATDYNSNEKLPTTIYGKIQDINLPINQISLFLKSEIDAGIDYFSSQVNQSQFFQPSQKTKLISNYKSFIDNTVLTNFNRVNIYIQNTIQTQIDMTSYMSKMDFVAFSGDGKTLSDGNPKLYSLTGTSENGSDTLVDFKTDYFEVMSGVTNFYNLGTGNTFISRSSVSGSSVNWSPIIPFSLASDKNVYILMSNLILDSFERDKMLKAITANMGDKQIEAEGLVNSILDYWTYIFTKEKNAEKKAANDFVKSQQMAPFSNFKPTVNGILVTTKERIMNFVTGQPNSIQEQEYKNIVGSVSYGPINDKNIFNGKKQFL